MGRAEKGEAGGGGGGGEGGDRPFETDTVSVSVVEFLTVRGRDREKRRTGR